MVKRGRRPQYDLKTEACPNPDCPMYGKTGEGNIVANGTYTNKEGEKLRKFICRACSKSFCSRSGTIFYDLRTPEDKVLMALKLLVKGTSLRGVAGILEVSLDTVRRWLHLASEQSERINEVLLKDLQVSQVELDALWSFVKKNALRQRAILWREKSGLGLPLPKNTG